MKILFVITKSNWGGAQSYVYTLATEYARRGDVVTVAFGGTGERGAPTGLLAERLAEASIPTVVLTGLMRDVDAASDLSAFRELLSVIKEVQPDVLHLNSSKVGGIGALAGRLAGVRKIVFTAHGWAHEESRSRIARALIWLASWTTVVLCHAVIVFSKRDAHSAPVVFRKSKIHIVPLGISAEDLLPRETARNQLVLRIPELGAPTTWIMTIAELHPNKGLDVLLRAFQKIVDRQPLAGLVIIGTGEQRAELETLVESLKLKHHVFFLGFVNDARKYIKAADVFVLPSRKEGLPFVLLEAALAKVPIIATTVGSIPELIADQYSGVLVHPGKSAALESALATLLSNESLRATYGEALYEKVVREYGQNRMYDKTHALYTSS